MSFAAVTAVQRKDAHTYTAHFDEDWVIGTVPHGGYVTSVFMRVLSQHFATTLSKQNQPHTLALHLDFLRRTQTGLATFTVKELKLGRQTSVVQVSLSQDGREEVVGTFTQSNLSTESGATFDTRWQPFPAILPLTSTVQLLSDSDPNWREFTQWPEAEFRKASRHTRFWVPRRGQSKDGLYDMWTTLREPGDRWTNESLGYLVDVFPQLLETYVLEGVDRYSPDFTARYPTKEAQAEFYKTKPTMAYWFPTLLLNLDVKKALPAEGVEFLFSRIQAKSIKNGRYDLEVLILDVEGEIVALSHHIVFALSAERNTAKRRGAKEGKEKL